MSGKRQRRRVGDIVSIALGHGKYGFGLILEGALIAFYDYQADQPNPAGIIETLRCKPVAFALWVMNYAVTSGRWTVIGRMEIPESLREKPKFFMQDALSGELSITTHGGDRIPATREQCAGLERAAVWDPEHVEDRLVDHFASRPNKWVESLRLL